VAGANGARSASFLRGTVAPMHVRRPPTVREPGWRAAYELTRDLAGYPLRVHRQYGPVAYLPIPRLPTYLIADPELIEHVLVRDHRSYVKDYTTRLLAQFLGTGLLTSEGELWRRQRRLAQPAFHHRRIESYAKAMVGEAVRELATWGETGERDMHADMMRLTLGIVSETLFGGDAREDALRVSGAVDVFMERTLGIWGTGLNLPAALPTPANRRYTRAKRELDDVLLRMIAARRSANQPRDDLLALFLEARDEDGARMTDRQLRDECVTMFVAGHETTALALTFALHLLSHHPGAERRVHEELEQVLGKRLPTVADLSALPVTQAVIKEAMRLYPPAYGIGREALRDTTLGPFDVPAKTQLLFWQYAVHRDPRYFPGPDDFQPERWLDGLEERLPRFAYFPFGGGPRICIGNTFAMMEAVFVLAVLVSRYRVESIAPLEVPLAPSVTLRPRGGLPARVTRRVA
jgi:cytochrome P450